MKARPEYFGWSREEQERYGVAIPERDHDRLSQALLEELWGRKIRSAKAAARAASYLPLADQHQWNEVVLPLTGIGDDRFFLNEGFAAGKTILDFPTLLAYDESDHRFQEEARKKEDSAYQGTAYRGTLHLAWALCLSDSSSPTQPCRWPRDTCCVRSKKQPRISSRS